MTSQPQLSAENARVVAAEAVARARSALERYASKPSGFEEWRKGDGSLVTTADLASDDEIAACIARLTPGLSILSEERTYRGDDRRTSWLVDPLCGTVTYSLGLSHWGVSVALQEGGRLVAGAFATSADDTPWSGGAEVGTSVGEEVVSSHRWPSELGTSILGLERSQGPTFPEFVGAYGEVLRRAGHIHTYGSAVYMGAQVVMGRIGAVLFPESDLVHCAGVAAVAEGAGLVVSDARGGPIDWSANHASLVLIAPPRIHAQVLEALNAR